MSRLPILDKIALPGSMIIDIFKQSFTFIKWRAAYIVSILQGVLIAKAVIFTAKNNHDNGVHISTSRTKELHNCRNDRSGRVPCGTSLILPIATLFSLRSCRRHRRNIAGTIVLLLALLLSLFSLYNQVKLFLCTQNI